MTFCETIRGCCCCCRLQFYALSTTAFNDSLFAAGHNSFEWFPVFELNIQSGWGDVCRESGVSELLRNSLLFDLVTWVLFLFTSWTCRGKISDFSSRRKKTIDSMSSVERDTSIKRYVNRAISARSWNKTILTDKSRFYGEFGQGLSLYWLVVVCLFVLNEIPEFNTSDLNIC